MFVFDNTCPFVEPSSCNEKCLFYDIENSSCLFKSTKGFIAEDESHLKKIWKYTESSGTLESEFYIWDKDKNTYEIIKWEYMGDLQDF